jgi:hypothetical protein
MVKLAPRACSVDLCGRAGQTLYIATSSLTLFDVTTQTVTATIQTPHGYIGLVGWRSIRMARKLL